MSATDCAVVSLCCVRGLKLTFIVWNKFDV